MYTAEIPRSAWPEFFKSFSLDHRDWLAEVEVLGSDIGVQTETRELKLEGISAELKDDGRDVIEIMVGEEAGDHITHTILAPVSVWIEKADAGRRKVLKIESEDGKMALVRFSAEELPETAQEIAAVAVL